MKFLGLLSFLLFWTQVLGIPTPLCYKNQLTRAAPLPWDEEPNPHIPDFEYLGFSTKIDGGEIAYMSYSPGRQQPQLTKGISAQTLRFHLELVVVNPPLWQLITVINGPKMYLNLVQTEGEAVPLLSPVPKTRWSFRSGGQDVEKIRITPELPGPEYALVPDEQDRKVVLGYASEDSADWTIESIPFSASHISRQCVSRPLPFVNLEHLNDATTVRRPSRDSDRHFSNIEVFDLAGTDIRPSNSPAALTFPHFGTGMDVVLGNVGVNSPNGLVLGYRKTSTAKYPSLWLVPDDSPNVLHFTALCPHILPPGCFLRTEVHAQMWTLTIEEKDGEDGKKMYEPELRNEGMMTCWFQESGDDEASFRVATYRFDGPPLYLSVDEEGVCGVTVNTSRDGNAGKWQIPHRSSKATIDAEDAVYSDWSAPAFTNRQHARPQDWQPPLTLPPPPWPEPPIDLIIANLATPDLVIGYSNPRAPTILLVPRSSSSILRFTPHSTNHFPYTWLLETAIEGQRAFLSIEGDRDSGYRLVLAAQPIPWAVIDGDTDDTFRLGYAPFGERLMYLGIEGENGISLGGPGSERHAGEWKAFGPQDGLAKGRTAGEGHGLDSGGVEQLVEISGAQIRMDL